MINILRIRPSTEVMRDFDALPKPVREAIAKANFAHDPAIIASRLGEQATVIATIERFDAGRGVGRSRK